MMLKAKSRKTVACLSFFSTPSVEFHLEFAIQLFNRTFYSFEIYIHSIKLMKSVNNKTIQNVVKLAKSYVPQAHSPQPTAHIPYTNALYYTQFTFDKRY